MTTMPGQDLMTKLNANENLSKYVNSSTLTIITLKGNHSISVSRRHLLVQIF